MVTAGRGVRPEGCRWSRHVETSPFRIPWLLERRRRAEAALTTVVATCYLLGVTHPADGKTRRDPRDHPDSPSPRSRSWPPTSTRRSRRSAGRPLDAGHCKFVAADALVLKVREGGRVVNVHTMVATGTAKRNALYRLQVTTTSTLGAIASNCGTLLFDRMGTQPRGWRGNRGPRDSERS
ncbi:DUF2625 family protein [Arthrobacter sp. ISL-85]|nr:DUF2625 family protein [Arthrobacter sp. ISL-85]